MGTSDGRVAIYKVAAALAADAASTQVPQLLQILNTDKAGLGGALPLDIALTFLPGASEDVETPVLMTTASTDRKIVFWLKDAGQEAFRKVLTLPGHDDWVRSLDFSTAFSYPENASDVTSDAASKQLVLASGSQDGSVRLWRIKAHTEHDSKKEGGGAGADAFDRLAKQVEDEASQQGGQTGASLSNKTHVIESEKGGAWAVTFDALLTGHESWVTGVRWQPARKLPNGEDDQPAGLLSASTDNSVILWTPSSGNSALTDTRRIHYPSLSTKEASSSLWLPSQRFGELGVAGAGALGMFGALWSPKWHEPEAEARQLILSHAWAGATHLYAFDGFKWESTPAVTGHGLAAKSARWAPRGDWFLTASLDRTARLFGQHVRNKITTWHELARPQTHGYDISAAAWLDDLSFASAADEKVARIFAAPQSFVESAKQLGALRRGAAGKPKRNVLALNLPTADNLRNPKHLQAPIETATKVTSTSRHKHLYILLCSPLFDAFCSEEGDENVQLSFEDIEGLLRWSYAQAWATAVKEGDLLVDIDVLLVGDSSAPRVVRELGSEESGAEFLWAVKGMCMALRECSREGYELLTTPRDSFLTLRPWRSFYRAILHASLPPLSAASAWLYPDTRVPAPYLPG